MDNKLKVSLKGTRVLKNALLNKDTAFSAEERQLLGLEGLLPPHIETIEEQVGRCYRAFSSKSNNLEKHIYLRSLQDRNETLFYYLVESYLTEMMPILYTPVVGEACMKFSHIYREPRGLFIAYPERARIKEILNNVPKEKDVRVIVVTDGERILGLGDQGVDGMGIPIGKLSLYTACGGIRPEHTLPIVLDVGTNNVERRNSPDYIGWRHERVTGDEYYDFLDDFVQGVKEAFPGVLLQFEDFAQSHASPLLKRYRQELCTFNDDIQGTAAVTVSALIAASKAIGHSMKDHRIVVVGAGSAGCGISEMLVQAMVLEGVEESKAHENFYLVDRYGLLSDNMTLLDFQKPFARADEALKDFPRNVDEQIGLKEVVSHVKPSVLLGVSGQPGLFNEEIIRLMNEHCDRPIVFPMSNPTSRAEAHPRDLIDWTDGRALVATGSPFDAVAYEGRSYDIAQSNNAYIFPGLGLGVLAVEATYISDEMFMAASLALSELSPALNDNTASLLPSLKDIHHVSRYIAQRVAKTAVEQGHCQEFSDKDIARKIDETFWRPKYLPYEAK